MEISAMAKVYATLIIKGLKTLDDVPERIREEVRQEIINRGYPVQTEDGDD